MRIVIIGVCCQKLLCQPLRSRGTSSVGGIIPTIARRFGHPMAGTPLTPTLCPSSMDASTVGENQRSCQAVSTSEAEMPKRSAIGTMTSRFEMSPCSVKTHAKRRGKKRRLRRRPFGRARAQQSQAQNVSSRYVAAGRLEVRLLELNARASREPVATPPVKTASVHLRAVFPDESQKEANANQLAVLAPLVRPKLSPDSKTVK